MRGAQLLGFGLMLALIGCTATPSAPPVQSRTPAAPTVISVASGTIRLPAGADQAVWTTRLETAVIEVSASALGPLLADWDGTLHLVVAADDAEYATVTGGDDAGMAAITECPPEGSRIIISPSVDALTEPLIAGVLLHEGIHAATGSACESTAPLWVDEGLAEWVAGQRHAALAELTVELATMAVTEKLPSALPRDEDFRSGDVTRVGQAYALSSVAIDASVKKLGAKATWKWLEGWTSDPQRRDLEREKLATQAYLAAVAELAGA